MLIMATLIPIFVFGTMVMMVMMTMLSMVAMAMRIPRARTTVRIDASLESIAHLFHLQ